MSHAAVTVIETDMDPQILQSVISLIDTETFEKLGRLKDFDETLKSIAEKLVCFGTASISGKFRPARAQDRLASMQQWANVV